MAKKTALEARVRYSASQNAFVIEILSDGEWTLCAAYPCVKAENKPADALFLHCSIVNQILEMVAMGYHIYKSDAVD